MSITPEFKEASTRAAIRGLRRLEQTAIMLETYAPDIFPEINEAGQKHFGRVMMECAAAAIRDAWKGAIVEIEAFPDDPANVIEQLGKMRAALFDVAEELTGYHDVEASVMAQKAQHAREIAVEALASKLVKKEG